MLILGKSTLLASTCVTESSWKRGLAEFVSDWLPLATEPSRCSCAPPCDKRTLICDHRIEVKWNGESMVSVRAGLRQGEHRSPGAYTYLVLCGLVDVVIDKVPHAGEQVGWHGLGG